MKILLCHGYYQQRGGEDLSFEAERKLLQDRGHEVISFIRHNDDVRSMSRWTVAAKTLWNRESKRQLQEILRREKPAIMHCTNLFPLISPSAYSAAAAEGVPVVQSLRNYRLLCANAFFLREGQPCEDCVHRSIPWPAIRHRCYRQSRAGSAVVAGMLVTHRFLRTWRRNVHLFYTLTRFARQKFIEGGFAPDRIVVKPNFLDPDPGPGTGAGGHFIFVGRLSPEKGIDTLLSAWEQEAGLPTLKIVGQGPLTSEVQQRADRLANVEVLGALPLEQALDLVGDAAALIMPSIWYETFGRTILEAYAKGTPVIASRLGAMQELVREGETGLLFEPGNATDLLQKVHQMRKQAPTMREQARSEYLSRYTPEQNYRTLMGIYQHAQEISSMRAAVTTGPEGVL